MINTNVTILLNTIDKVKNFVNKISLYDELNIYLQLGRYIVNGKSVLGIFSLDLNKRLEVYIDSIIPIENNIQYKKCLKLLDDFK